MTLRFATVFLGASVGLLLSMQVAQAQAALRGIVRADSTGRPIAGVQVLIEGTERVATTSDAGRFLLGGLPAGRRTVLFRTIGFRPFRHAVELVDRDTVWAEALLVPGAAQELEPVVVTEHAKQPRGIGVESFEERRRLGFGRFIDSAMIRRSEHLRVSDVLERVQSGIRLIDTGDGIHGPNAHHLWAASSRRPSAVWQRHCWMQVIVDGVVLYSSANANPMNEPPDFRRDFQVASFQAIEIYRSAAETPIEFGGPGADCGTIVLWSRRGP